MESNATKPVNGVNIMDPKQMIAPIYGQSNILTSAVYGHTRPPVTPRSPLKGATRTTSSPIRKMLPFIVGIISFASVLSILIICMDTTGNC